MKRFFILLLFVPLWIQSQNTSFKVPDSIQNKDFVYLEDRIDQFKDDSTRAAIYLFTYINKAKREHNWQELKNGYQNLMHLSPSSMRIIYADSMVYAAKKAKDNAAIGSAFLTKGIVLFSNKKYKEALDDYLIANEYIAKTNDQYLIYKVKYNIAQLKNSMGFYDEAISLLRECVNYYKKNHDRAYLNSLHSLGLSYNKVGNYGLCSITNEEGIKESAKRASPEMSAYFQHSEGVNQYFLHNYQKAITNLKSTMPEIESNNDFANEAVGNFYIGKSYWELKKHETAIPYFKKVDQILNSKQFIRRDLLETFALLINYYKTKKEDKLHLYYIDQLLIADHLLLETNSYLVSKVSKEYDNKNILIQKQKLEQQVNGQKSNNLIFIVLVTLIFLTLLFVSYRNFKIKSTYKKNYDALMNKSIQPIKEITPIQHAGIADINAVAVTELIRQLEKWEQGKKFLDKEITLVKLAATFNSNTKYLSLVVYHHRHKKFVT
ncbi:tetratricopeptide repeat protein [Flavobacterium frigoris]|uniref:Tetratricopeptide repeat-containing protein n=1 Tax=Flavobacterium frigoris TaxID=229204 RepID=A0A1H9H7Q5_FLAFI|nr:tetratricopeptide repeat protein [Flavobacterium frigoris]SEQ58293.1 Tetratricopeptide repeat-containing protein [Flavobacterium frigoris]